MRHQAMAVGMQMALVADLAETNLSMVPRLAYQFATNYRHISQMTTNSATPPAPVDDRAFLR